MKLIKIKKIITIVLLTSFVGSFSSYSQEDGGSVDNLKDALGGIEALDQAVNKDKVLAFLQEALTGEEEALEELFTNSKSVRIAAYEALRNKDFALVSKLILKEVIEEFGGQAALEQYAVALAARQEVLIQDKLDPLLTISEEQTEKGTVVYIGIAEAFLTSTLADGKPTENGRVYEVYVMKPILVNDSTTKEQVLAAIKSTDDLQVYGWADEEVKIDLGASE